MSAAAPHESNRPGKPLPGARCPSRTHRRGNPFPCKSSGQTHRLAFALAPALIYAVVIALLWHFTAVTPERDGRGHDGRFYAMMSGDESHNSTFIPVAPFCFRPLTPSLASLLDGPVVWRFRLVNAIAWWAALLAFHVLIRQCGLSTTAAYIGCVMLATCAWGPIAGLYNPCYVDPLMYLFIFAGLILLLRRSMWLAVLLPIAMLQREQILIVWACSLSLAAVGGIRTISRRAAINHALILFACMLVYAGLRWWIEPVFSTAAAPWAVAASVIKWLFEDAGYAVKSVLAIIYALGLPAIAVLCLPEARAWMREQRWPIVYVAIAGLCIFGGSDKARLVFIATPVLIIALLHGWSRLPDFARRPSLATTALLLHVYFQLPPHLMFAGGRIIAPLVDEMDRGTHGANFLHGPGWWPVEMSAVALHVLGCAALGWSLACVALRDTHRAASSAPTVRLSFSPGHRPG